MNSGVAAKLFVLAGLCVTAGLSADSVGLARSQSGGSRPPQQGSTVEQGAKSRAAGSTKATTPGAASSRAAPSAEEIAVYKAFMTYFVDQAPFAQVSDVTYPMPVANAHRCLHGVQLEKSDAAAARAQTVPQDILSDTNQFRLVTIRSDSERHERLLRLSDIAFDARHQYAVVNYSYHCGFLCGEGSTVVFKKVGNRWKHLRSCVEWMS